MTDRERRKAVRDARLPHFSTRVRRCAWCLLRLALFFGPYCYECHHVIRGWGSMERFLCARGKVESRSVPAGPAQIAKVAS